MGMTELSVRPSAVPAVKAQVRRFSGAAARALAEEVAALPAAAVADRIDRAHEIEIGLDVRETRHSW
jgi:phosphoenolpyruvate-protein kinase (PTS system EI component)